MLGQEGIETVKSSIYIASFAIFILVVFIVLFAAYYQRKQAQQRISLQEMEAEMQKRLLENSIEIQETERRRIAKDLHDDVGAMLSATKMSLKQLFRQAVGQEQILTLANNTKEMLEESIGQVRRISKELVPSTLEGFGLVVALEEFINKLQPIAETSFELKYENLEHEERFDRKIELTIYRIAQELVNNAFKHAEAEKISLMLLKTDKSITFNFTDNGKGFDLESTMQDPKSGLGLRNIQSRLSVVSGKLDIKSSIGKGTITTIEIPFPV
jgi:signal transduction histidine kinase